jgi:hypothetical protein
MCKSVLLVLVDAMIVAPGAVAQDDNSGPGGGGADDRGN